MYDLFFEFFTRPLANLLMILGNATGGEMGIAILLLTLAVRLILFPLTARIVRDQEEMRALEPELARIRKQFSGSRMQQGQEISKLFRQHGVSSFRPLLLTLVQLPVLFALWRIFFALNAPALNNLAYSFVRLDEAASFDLFGFMPLGSPSITLAFATGFLQWASQRHMATTVGGGMLRWLFPIFSVVILASLPSALGIYWASSLAFGILEQRWVTWRRQKRQKKS